MDRATEVAVASVALVDAVASLDSLRRLSVVLSAVSCYPPTHLISNNTNVEHLLITRMSLHQASQLKEKHPKQHLHHNNQYHILHYYLSK